jgi:hypothetical protein
MRCLHFKNENVHSCHARLSQLLYSSLRTSVSSQALHVHKQQPANSGDVLCITNLMMFLLASHVTYTQVQWGSLLLQSLSTVLLGSTAALNCSSAAAQTQHSNLLVT